VDTCDRKPNYKGGQLYRFYCTLLLPCPVVQLSSDGHGEETHWKKTISGHHALHSKIILKHISKPVFVKVAKFLNRCGIFYCQGQVYE